MGLIADVQHDDTYDAKRHFNSASFLDFEWRFCALIAYFIGDLDFGTRVLWYLPMKII